MQQATCFLLFNNQEFYQYTHSLIRESFGAVELRNLETVAHLESAMAARTAMADDQLSSCILITDAQPIADKVRMGSEFLPVVLLDESCPENVSTQFSPSQVVDFSDGHQVSTAIKTAIDSSARYFKLKSQTAKLETLAERERKIIALASEGVPNKTIAVRLGISIKTVEKNRRIAYSKLAVSSTAEMASLVTFGRFLGSVG